MSMSIGELIHRAVRCRDDSRLRTEAMRLEIPNI